MLEPGATAKPADAGFAELNGTRLYYEVRGSGPALVLVHAGIADHRMWDPQFEALQSRFRVLRYDVRGWGKSRSPEGSYSDAADLLALLDHVGMARVSLIGCSNGGRITLDFTLLHPDRVQALVLVGSAVSGAPTSELVKAKWARIEGLVAARDLDGAVEQTLRMWVDGPDRAPEQVDPAARLKAKAMLDELYQLPEEQGHMEQLQPPAIERLGEVRVPTLVVIGDRDVHEIVERSDRLAREIPGARKQVIAGAAHLPNLEKPSEFLQIVLDFLTGPLASVQPG